LDLRLGCEFVMSKGIRWGSLRTKIIAWSFIPTVIILAAVALVTYLAYENVAEELVLGRDRELAYLSAAQLKEDLNNYADELASVARMSDLRSNDNLGLANALQEASARLVYFDAGVSMLDSFGIVVASMPDRPEILGQNWSDRAYFRQILYSRKAVFSDVLYDGLQDKPVIVFAIPIMGDKGEFFGVLAGMFDVENGNLSPFYGNISKTHLRQNGSVYLVDGNGTVIYHSDGTLIGTDYSQYTNVQDVLGGGVGALRSRNNMGRDTVTAYAPIPGTNWGFITEDEWSSLSEADERYGQYLLLLLGFGIILPAFVVSIGVERVLKPIQDLKVAAQRVAEGDFGLSIDAHTHDEIEDLANQFNRMSAELNEYYSNLEQKIAARTKELAALYEVSAAASSSLDLDIVLQRSLEQVLKVMGLESGAIHLLDDEQEKLELAASQGFKEEQVPTAVTIPLGTGLASWVIENQEPMVIANVSDFPRPLMVIPAQANQAYVGVPIHTRGQMMGVLSVIGEPGREFSPEEVALLASISDDVALAVDNARLFAQAEKLAVMEERSRLARELHDSVTQLLYSLTLFAEAGIRMNQAHDPERTDQFLQRVNETARQAHKEMRLLIYELRPPTLAEEGLVGALQHRLDSVEKRSGLDACLEVEGDLEIPMALEDGLFRVTVEALNNALKHASATQVSVRLRQQGPDVSLEVIDNGMGFDLGSIKNGGGMGLQGMSERVQRMGGSLQISSKPGAGTRISVDLNMEVA
jgi:nitrate/nitrite-specific signal transduction histidine kinase